MTFSVLASKVQERAANRCEYCLMHQALQGATFHIEHILPSSKGGATSVENLAWCCPSCNLHKSDRTDAVDPETGEKVSLFNPRQHIWTQHFAWSDYQIAGKSPIGRATILLLNLNTERRMRVRRAEELFDLFPPD